MNRNATALAPILVLFAGLAAFGQDGANPRLWAVVVSVGDYPEPIPSRLGASTEGRQLARWLTTSAGWDSSHVLELNDNGSPNPPPDLAVRGPLRPTRSNLDWAMGRWLNKWVKEGDVVLLAFAGRGIATSRGEALLPIDHQPGEEGWTPDRWIERLALDSKCSSVLCWIDAPFLDPAKPGANLPDAGDQLLKRLARWQRSSVWLATGEPPAHAGSSAGFSTRLHAALGDGRQSLLASLADLNRDPAIAGLRFRHLGGVPRDLNLSRDLIRAPRGAAAELLVQSGHSNKVVAVAVQADGRAMVTASDDSTLRVWDPTARQRALLRVLPGFLNGVSALALSSDGRIVVGGDGMGNVQAWDLSAGGGGPLAPVGSVNPHATPIKAIAFLPDDLAGKTRTTRFVTVGSDGRCERWEVEGRTVSRKTILAPRLQSVLLSAATSPKAGHSFAILEESGLLHVFDRTKAQVETTFRVPCGTPSALLLDPDGRWAAIGDAEGRVKVVDVATKNVTFEHGPLAGPISTLKLGPGGRIAIGAGDAVHLVRIGQPGNDTRLEVGGSPVRSLEFSTDGGWLAASGGASDLFVWRLQEGQAPAPLALEWAGLRVPAFSCVGFGTASGGVILVAGENDGGIRRRDFRTFEERPA